MFVLLIKYDLNISETISFYQYNHLLIHIGKYVYGLQDITVIIDSNVKINIAKLLIICSFVPV